MSMITLPDVVAPRVPASAAEDPDLAAFNAAFGALDLDWHWDPELYRSLPHDGDDRATLGAWLSEHRAHLLKVYDLTFLCDAVLAAKQRYRAAARTAGGP